MMILEWERRVKQSKSGDHSDKEASKKAFAKTIMEIASVMHKQSEVLQTLARKLDMRVVSFYYSSSLCYAPGLK